MTVKILSFGRFVETIYLLFLPVCVLVLDMGWILISLALVVSLGVFFVRGYTLFKPMIDQVV